MTGIQPENVLMIHSMNTRKRVAEHTKNPLKVMPQVIYLNLINGIWIDQMGRYWYFPQENRDTLNSDTLLVVENLGISC